MASVNKAILIGNLGKDAEMRYTTGGTAVISVSMATTDKYTDREGNKREDTQWHNIVIWGKTAEAICEFLKKGKQIYVEGKLQTRKWQDKEGKDRYTTEVRADRVVLLGGGGGEGRGRSRRSEDTDTSAATEDPMGADIPADDDGVPF